MSALSRETWISAVAGIALAAAPAPAPAPALAQDTSKPTNAAFETASTNIVGKPVTIEFLNVSPASVNKAAEILTANGCPTTIITDGFFEGIEISTNGETHTFDDAADATGWALKRCLG